MSYRDIRGGGGKRVNKMSCVRMSNRVIRGGQCMLDVKVGMSAHEMSRVVDLFEEGGNDKCK